MKRFLACLAPVALILVLVPVASALTVAEVTSAAEALLDDYEALEVLIDACPDGECPGAGALKGQLDALEVDLLQLHVDRDSLGSCSCTYLDGVIDGIDDLSETLRSTVGQWNGQT